MAFDPNKHHRRSIRLKGYDYAQAGAYYVTICAQDRQCLFGHILDGQMIPNPAGQMVNDVWTALPEKYPTVILDEFVVMPNHFHCIVFLANDAADADKSPKDHVGANAPVRPHHAPDDHVGANAPVRPDENIGQTRGSAPTGTGVARPKLSDVIRWFKSLTTAKYRYGVRDDGWMPFPGRVWQRNYYEHIIRNERSLKAIRLYIVQNPANWPQDSLYEE